jgi:transcriptional regulator with XRE-family HTH domain
MELAVVPEALKRARLEACMTQSELARAAGVRRETIARLEAGSPARPSSVRKIAAALGLKPDAITRIQGAA